MNITLDNIVRQSVRSLGLSAAIVLSCVPSAVSENHASQLELANCGAYTIDWITVQGKKDGLWESSDNSLLYVLGNLALDGLWETNVGRLRFYFDDYFISDNRSGTCIKRYGQEGFSIFYESSNPELYFGSFGGWSGHSDSYRIRTLTRTRLELHRIYVPVKYQSDCFLPEVVEGTRLVD